MTAILIACVKRKHVCTLNREGGGGERGRGEGGGGGGEGVRRVERGREGSLIFRGVLITEVTL